MRKKEMKELYDLDYEMNHKGKIVEKAVYTGDYYRFEEVRYEKSRVAGRLLVSSVLIASLFVIAAFLNTDGTRSFFIGVPYVFIFMPVCYMIMGAFSFLTLPGRINKIEYSHSLVRILRSTWGILWLEIYIILTNIVFVIVSFSGILIWKEIFFVGFNGFSLLLCWFQIKYIQTVCRTMTVESQAKAEEPQAKAEEPQKESQ